MDYKKINFDLKYRDDIIAGKVKVETTQGYPVKILCWDVKTKNGYPIVGLVPYSNENEAILTYSTEGKALLDFDESRDLVLLVPKEEETVEPDYNPYKETVNAILNMFEKYDWLTTDKEDFINNIKVKCKDAVEYETGTRQTDKPAHKFNVGDVIYSKNNNRIVYRITAVNVPNEIGGYDYELEYVGEPFEDNHKNPIINRFQTYRVDEWGEKIEPDTELPVLVPYPMPQHTLDIRNGNLYYGGYCVNILDLLKKLPVAGEYESDKTLRVKRVEMLDKPKDLPRWVRQKDGYTNFGTHIYGGTLEHNGYEISIEELDRLPIER